ncbi:hypothetical protein SanaruYs_12730 [Chryseotalea sanaruensis]|uniref:SbsA Ig-like domain-containing protein n=1 Tax=Chryseotalea sanaruensis TaxID=2482724 RepID=A0A401U833_9BACT|nr:Ig-like domain-containing protein [Chryseotalea sanaruensis]GCC51053.1 hypothetical protein SanaruYs_12730 [Chryseotalea sanaruensis]
MNRVLALLYVVLLISCAQQTNPTGGPKDEEPPVLLESNPKNGSVNFKGNQIELTFSEPIQLMAVKEQLIISPNIKETETSFVRNKVILKLKSPLRDSTTYTINFREAVQDLTEKNIAKDVKLAISTGTYLDSLKISGHVYELPSGKPMKDVTIALHYQNDTFNIFKHRAEIVTKADENGEFVIENLKPTNYYLYAFQDKNKNLIVDGRNEKYGFLTRKFSLLENEENIEVPLVSLDSRTIKFISAKPFQNYYYVKTSKAIASYSLQFSGQVKNISQIGEDKASIKVYKNFTDVDSLNARFIIRDSLNNQIDTTLYVKFNPPNPQARLDKFTSSLDQVTILKKNNQLNGLIKFNKPLKQLNLDSIYFSVDSLTRYSIEQADIKLDTQLLTITISKLLPQLEAAKSSEVIETEIPKTKGLTSKGNTVSKLNELILGKSALISVDQDSSARLNIKPKMFSEEDLAITNVDSNSKSLYYFIELINSKGQVIQTAYNQAKFSFTNIEPGEYSVRLIEDINNNGKWDAGNYFKSEEPEPIFYYFDDTGSPKFNIKANWEYGPLLIDTEKGVNNLGTKKEKSN